MVYVPVGTQVILKSADETRPAVGAIASQPEDESELYRIRLVDGSVVEVAREAFRLRKESYDQDFELEATAVEFDDLIEFVILRCVVGSRAYGLAGEGSDTDLRGVYLPPADIHWSMTGAPGQIERRETDECYWELQKFLALALKANPNILECLYTPLVVEETSLGRDLREMRSCFLSKFAYRTYNGYVLSQFKRLEQDLRTHGEPRWKHAMHLVRLLLSGIGLLRDGRLEVAVGEHRDRLLAIKRGEWEWRQVEEWRLVLHEELERAHALSSLPEAPDFEAANRLLLRARREAVKLEWSRP